MDNKLRTSKDSFYKKVSSSKGFTHQSKVELYPTLIQMLKSDLIAVQDMIVSNSSDIKMYKILSKNPNLVRKLTEIEDNPEIQPHLEKISELSQNIEKIGKTYGCQNGNDLIKKLYLELGYNELLNKKLCDFFILMKLKLCNDETFQDSLSRVIPLKDFIDKLIQKLKSNTNSNDSQQVHEAKSTMLTGINESKNTQQMKEYDDLLKIGTLNEMLESDLSKNKLYAHFYKLLCNYFQNMNISIKQTIEKYNGNNKKETNKGNEIDKFFKLKESIENIIKQLYEENIQLKKPKEEDNTLNESILKLKEENDSLNAMKMNYEDIIKNNELKITALQKEIESLQSKANENKVDSSLKYTEEQYNTMKTKLESDLNTLKISSSSKENALQNQINELTNKIKELEEQLKTNSNKSPNTVSSSQPVEKVNIQEIMRKHEQDFKKMKEETNRKLDTEIKELNEKMSKLKEHNSTLKLENESLKKQTDTLNSKNFDPDSYEQVLLEQFETMKSAFIKKIDDMTEELSQLKSDSRTKIYSLEQELKESQHLKDVFLQQIVQLQKQLNI